MSDIIRSRTEWQKGAHVQRAQYEAMYKKSLTDPDAFWAEQGTRLKWLKPFQRVRQGDFHKVDYQWFVGGKLNVSENCIDRHLPQRAQQTAIIWEPDQPQAEARHITYQELSEHVNRLANTLKSRGVKKGDRVIIYLPMVPEAAYALLACARIGAIHCVVFAGFSVDSLADRMRDCQSTVVITADEGRRAGKTLPLKALVDEACAIYTGNHTVLTLKVTGASVAWQASRDIWYHEVVPLQSPLCAPEVMDAEDPLFILYTSGSTNKPKGVLHTTAGYLLYVALTHQWVFDYRPGEVYWCTADIGWVTGHSYLVYGPLANGATTLMFEGVPTYPDSSRIWQIVDRHSVHILYTAPTLIRALMRDGEAPVRKTKRSSLRILGSVGEPINPEAWLWYYSVAGDERCPVVDTWWQTETGGILISPLPGVTDLKPGSATRPLFGVEPVLVTNEGAELKGVAEGNLCLRGSWPGQVRTVYGDHQRFVETYFASYPGLYFTGDGCRRDEDGYYWITGRVDDVLNVSGHRLGTAEIESALVSHTSVAEAAVVGYPHDLKGQGVYAFVTLKTGVNASDSLREQLVQHVRTHIGALAKPDFIQWAPGLPKTRSGKIMRRILRKIAEDQFENLGDITTLADPSVVQQLIDHRMNRGKSIAPR
jgi:acetyl-CoA synthetase